MLMLWFSIKPLFMQYT